MKVNLTKLLMVLSDSLNYVEEELLGITTGHTQRVAYLCMLVAKQMHMSQDYFIDFIAASILHDNAIPQYIEEECDRSVKMNKPLEINTQEWLGNHCEAGEQNLLDFPFHTDMTGVIRYHHERANGTGPFHQKELETPILAQIIHICDVIDRYCFCKNKEPKTYSQVLKFVHNGEGTLYSSKCVRLFCENVGEEEFAVYMSSDIRERLKTKLPVVFREYTFQELKPVALFVAKLIDYKSEFTAIHSVQLAQKAATMADYYQMEQDEKDQFYIAALLHDLGKFAIGNDFLEKNGKLSMDEFEIIKNHAYYTYTLLSSVNGFEKITEWASNHHEKLNGSGYPFGKTSKELDRNSRLLACLDIYQALTEERPYKKRMSHEESMVILYQMVGRGELDGALTDDVNFVFGEAV